MPRRFRHFRLLLLSLGLLLSLPLSAHKLKVFASVEGDTILGRAYFVGGAAASGAEIRITDDAGSVLARPKPDGDGNFRYRVERRADFSVVADSLDGHRASWTLKADEFSSGLPAAGEGDGTAGTASSPALASRPAPASSGEAAVSLSPEQLDAAVARQIRPLREALQAYEEQVRLRDILGGIGYIVGLAGFGLWWGGRRRKGAR